MISPLNFQQATKISKDYQFIVGLPFNADKTTSAVIECLAVIPFDNINRQKFILYYILLNNWELAIQSMNYKGLLFDVAVIARNDFDEIEHTDIFTWLSNNKKIISATHLPPMISQEHLLITP